MEKEYMDKEIKNTIIPMNDYLLIKIEDESKSEKKSNGLYYGENKDKPKKGEILAYSEECKNKNFEVGKTVVINRYEMIPHDDTEDEFFVSEKAIVAMF